MRFKFIDNFRSRSWPVRPVKAAIFIVLAFSFAGTVRAEYFVFAGGHAGYTFYDTIDDIKLTNDRTSNTGLDFVGAFGTEDYGIGLTYTTSTHSVKDEARGIRLENNLQGPGIIFSMIRTNPSDSKVLFYIGVESLQMTTKTSKCGGTAGQLFCDKLEKDLSDNRAQTIVLGIIDTSAIGLGIGLTGRIYQSDVIDRAYDLNLMIGVGF
ncbi:MAG: hypothetical protein ACC635_00720 [Acidiferrobacterales bacterium]